MFDTHCHLQVDAFDADREEVLAKSAGAGVGFFLVPNIDRSTFEATIEIAKRANVYCALGIHPHHAAEWDAEMAKRIRNEAAGNPKVAAIGEIGLDYYYDFAPRDRQLSAFREQIALAQELGLPVVIHTRDSIPETLDIVQECYSGLVLPYAHGQFHCFSGTVGEMELAVGTGFCVSFTGNITFKNSTLGEVVEAAPLERILIETDSPYLAPVPHRGKRNTPELLGLVARKIAEIKKMDVETVMTKTTENATKLFSRVSALAVIVLTLLSASAIAQPGSRPPDSVLTKERREAEEVIRKQREELARAAEERRQDSLRASQQEAAERRLQAEEQARKDSIKAVERLADLERERIKMQTPVAWKTLGITGAGGIGSLTVAQLKFGGTISPTAVFSTTFGVSSQITNQLDAELSYNSFTIKDNDLARWGIYTYHDSMAVKGIDTGAQRPTQNYRQLQSESMTTSYVSFDIRFVITPHSPIKFYTGIGFTSVVIKSEQQYILTDYVTRNAIQPGARESSISRSGIKALIGARYDYELGSQFIITPFVQIGAAFLFNGDPQKIGYVFNVEKDPIVFTHTTIGFTFNYSFGLTGERQ